MGGGNADLRLWGTRFVQFIAANIEHAIEACTIVLKSDLPAELEQLFFRELFAQASVEVVGDVRRRRCHGICQFDDQAFDVRER